MLRVYNTLSQKKEVFKSIKNKQVGLYTCGPTVYWFAHIGNLRTYIFEDILRRVLEYNNYKVKQVMNITDVGHLTSDADSGEDKMVKALKREGKKLNKQSMLEVADFYTKTFKKDLKHLNIQEPHLWPKATDHIKEQISLIKQLFKNGYAYEAEEAVYFDTSRLKDYGKLAKLDIKGLKEGARAEKRAEKRNPTDFALWLKSVSSHKNHIMNWDSPWGKGFPGWHLECSAMSMKYLGTNFDIHCGGIDHKPVHHTNERAQNIGAVGHSVVNFWLHGEFLNLKTGRMGKSEGNIIVLNDLIKKDFNPLAFRYLSLGAHYRSELTFSWKSIESSQKTLDKLYQKVLEIKTSPQKITDKNSYQKKFLELINDDLNMPKALALTWQLIKDKKIKNAEKYSLLLEFDKVFGLGLKNLQQEKIPQVVLGLAKHREKCREEKNWAKSDQLRNKIEKLGFSIEDTPTGPKLKKV